MDDAFKQLLAFLLCNNLLCDRQLVFFTDGAANLRCCIERYFSFRPYMIILDFFHLAKRVREICIMAFKGKKEQKTDLVNSINRKLWDGDSEAAIALVSSFPDSMIKNEDKLYELISYLERKKPSIAPVSVRKALNLRMGSGPAEKTNDLLVASRQKHRRMSWSPDGGSAFAKLQCISLNNMVDMFVRERKFSFSFDSVGWNISSNRAA